MVTKVGDAGVRGLADGDHRRILDPSLTALQFKVAGSGFTNNSDWVILPETTITLTDDFTNIIVIDTVNLAYARSEDLTVEGRVALYTVTTASGVISSVVDHRSMFVSKNSGLDFEAVVASIGAPLFRFKCNEASTPLADSGSFGGDDLDAAGAPVYQAAGLDTGGGGNSLAVTLDGTGDGFKSGAGDYGNQTGDTGSWLVLFKQNVSGTNTRQILWAHGFDGTTVGVELELDATNGKLTFISYDGGLPIAEACFLRTQNTANGGIDCADGAWHTVIITKKKGVALFADNLKDVFDIYIDGLYMNDIAGMYQFTGSTSNPDNWMDNLPATSDISIGKENVNAGTDELFGDISEVIYWDTTVLNQSQANNLHTALGLSLGTSSPTESLLLRRLSERDLHSHYRMNDTATPLVDRLGNSGDQIARGTPTYENAFITGEKSVGLDDTNNESWLQSGFGNMVVIDSGYFVLHFKHPQDSQTTILFQNGATGGQPYRGVHLNGNNSLVIHLVNSGGFGVNELRTSIDFGSGNPEVIKTDTWHQLIVHQPADGSGLSTWFDGTKYINTDSEVTEQIWGASTADNWFDTNESTFSIGSEWKTPIDNVCEGFLSNFAWSATGAKMDDTYAAQLWAATGL